MEVPVSFERYDDEFRSLIGQIEKSLAPEETGSANLTHNLLQQCEDLIKQMALEARGVPNPNMKRNLLGKVQECKATWRSLKDQANQKELLSSHVDGGGNGKYRDRMQGNEDMLSRQNDTLENARRIMEETEVVALEITDELGHNREKLMSAHGRIHEVTGMTGRARRLLVSMNQRAVQQKMCMYGVAVAGALLIIFAWWGM
ncbi:Vesicle transport v-SNARE [Seminavis robusta]|uniref:Vesicle transport v-SNARE n=1 Tax=Seminavis robusta TaxID=568900 RepID=A0A9N8DCN7_9STRA|nr:Vesicle transport v-SNARE [Seminavis robusta]|eukprot:Sro35_g022340.1 Vesicle transport v-SNARE (202) ;mRNA; r:74156-74761